MEEREIEEKLQTSADEVMVRDFSKVWERIESRVAPTRAKRRKLPKWAVGVLSSVAAVALISAITIPVLLNNQGNEEIVYFWDELNTVQVQETEFFEKIESSGVACVDLRRYITSTYSIYQTIDEIVKGGRSVLTDSNDVPTFFISMQFYDSSVELGSTTVVYDTSYTTATGATVEYKLKDYQPDYSLYTYDVKASYQSVNYYMEYKCFTEDITPFLESFFSS